MSENSSKPKTFLNWFLCGYKEGGKHEIVSFWWGWTFDLSTRRGRAFYWLLGLCKATKDTPFRCKLWFADQLIRCAMRLRNEKVSVFGFYDCAIGNRAAQLCDDIRLKTILNDHEVEIRENLEELASIAGATWISNNAKA